MKRHIDVHFVLMFEIKQNDDNKDDTVGEATALLSPCDDVTNAYILILAFEKE